VVISRPINYFICRNGLACISCRFQLFRITNRHAVKTLILNNQGRVIARVDRNAKAALSSHRLVTREFVWLSILCPCWELRTLDSSLLSFDPGGVPFQVSKYSLYARWSLCSRLIILFCNVDGGGGLT